MARKLVKRDWGQAKGGYTPFAKSSPKADTSNCHCYEAVNAKGEWYLQKCSTHR